MDKLKIISVLEQIFYRIFQISGCSALVFGLGWVIYNIKETWPVFAITFALVLMTALVSHYDKVARILYMAFASIFGSFVVTLGWFMISTTLEEHDYFTAILFSIFFIIVISGVSGSYLHDAKILEKQRLNS